MNTNFADPTHGEDRDDMTPNEMAKIPDIDPDKLKAKLGAEIKKLQMNGNDSTDFTDTLMDMLKQLKKQMASNQDPNGDHVVFNDEMEPTGVVINGKEWPVKYDIQGAAEDKLDNLAEQLIEHCRKHCLPIFLVVQKGQDGNAARFNQTASVPGPRCDTTLHMVVRISNALLKHAEVMPPSFMMHIYSEIMGRVKREKGSVEDDE